jgi:hypothetical protein
VSEIESTHLPPDLNRIIIWDDVFSSRNVLKGVKSIMKVFPEYYGFDPLLGTNRCSFHGFSKIGPVIQRVLPATTGTIGCQRLALIDVESCGVSRIDWHDILPHLRTSYDFIIGFAHFAGRGPSNLQELCDGAFENSRTLNALGCCDLSFCTSDSLLGFDEALDYEARAPVLTALVNDLVHVLTATNLVWTLAGMPKVTQFVVSSSRQERPHGNFSSNLEYDAKCAPLMDGYIAL